MPNPLWMTNRFGVSQKRSLLRHIRNAVCRKQIAALQRYSGRMTPEVINYYARSYYEGGRLLCYVAQSTTDDMALTLIPNFGITFMP
jgi:hypothetical protein